MRWKKVVSVLSAVVVVAVLTMPAWAQKGQKGKLQDPYDELAAQELAAQGTRTVTSLGTLIQYDQPLPEADAISSSNWELHNLDLAGSLYCPLDQINTSSAKSLVPVWQVQTGVVGSGFHITPIVVNGVMYTTSQAAKNVEAFDAATGQVIWSFKIADDVVPSDQMGARNRGVAYGDGTLYVLVGPSVLAFDAKTGKPVDSFGAKGKSDVLFDILKAKYPDLKRPFDKGFYFTAAPQYYKGMVIAGTGFSESTPPGGLLYAVDAKTGKLIWKFNTIPQDPSDQGWDIAKDTWSGTQRTGGSIWETPSIDPVLGTLYLQTANPFPYTDGSWRSGINLFSSSIVALDVNTGKMKWYFQQVHHDLWDYDSGSPCILFDVQVNGKTVKAVAESNKDGLLYVLNRETGKPVFPILELPVPTATTRVGEKPWPTQPIPFTANGRTIVSVSPQVVTDLPPELTQYIVPQFTPPGANQIRAYSGTNFGPISFSPRTGMLYVTARGRIANTVPNTTIPENGYLSAVDASTLELVWQRKLSGTVQGGTVVTAGNVVFVGAAGGFLYAFDARTGDELWKFNTGAGIAATPMIYMINGKEFVSVASGGSGAGRLGDTIMTFALFGQ